MKQPSLRKLTDLPVVDLGDILLRPVRYEDYPDIFAYASDPEVTKTLAWNTYKDIEEAKNAVQNVFLARPSKGIPAAYAIVHKADNKMIGTCDFFSVDWNNASGEIGYVLNRNYWGHGYMTKVCGALIEFGFSYLKLGRIDIRHLKENVGSQRVIEKNGFRYVGTTYHKTMEVDLPTYVLTRADYRRQKRILK